MIERRHFKAFLVWLLMSGGFAAVLYSIFYCVRLIPWTVIGRAIQAHPFVTVVSIVGTGVGVILYLLAYWIVQDVWPDE